MKFHRSQPLSRTLTLTLTDRALSHWIAISLNCWIAESLTESIAHWIAESLTESIAHSSDGIAIIGRNRCSIDLPPIQTIAHWIALPLSFYPSTYSDGIALTIRSHWIGTPHSHTPLDCCNNYFWECVGVVFSIVIFEIWCTLDEYWCM
jgi:hypothetical protein